MERPFGRGGYEAPSFVIFHFQDEQFAPRQLSQCETAFEDEYAESSR